MAYVERENLSSLSRNPICFVHEKLDESKWTKIPDAQAEVQEEYDNLRAITTWDEDKVEEYSAVCARYSRLGKKAHFGLVYPICHIKHAEMAKEHQKLKKTIINNILDNFLGRKETPLLTA